MDKEEIELLKLKYKTTVVLGIMAALMFQVLIFGIFIMFDECICDIGCMDYIENNNSSLSSTGYATDNYFEISDIQ